jgi:hypothetical protein
MKVMVTCNVRVTKEIEIADELCARYQDGEDERAVDEFHTAIIAATPGFEGWDNVDVEDEAYDFEEGA